MCGPVEKCCCCYPARVGVKIIASILIVIEVGGLIYNTIIIAENNLVRLTKYDIVKLILIIVKSFRETIGGNMPGFAVYLTGDICGYLLAIFVNIILIYGSAIDNRCLFKTKRKRKQAGAKLC